MSTKLFEEPQQNRTLLHIPVTFDDSWPWLRKISPYYDEIKAESEAWIQSFQLFSTPHWRKTFYAYDGARAAALIYPKASREHLRLCSDFMYIFVIIDDYTDGLPASNIREIVDIMFDAMKHPQKARPEGEADFGQIVKEYWERMLQFATPGSAKRFFDMFSRFLESFYKQASDPTYNGTVAEFLVFRGANGGCLPAKVLGEMHINLTDEVLSHPVVKELEAINSDLFIIDQDIFSYNKEQALGDDRYNYLTIAMRQFALDLNEAINWAVSEHKRLQAKFIQLVENELPSFGPELNKDLEEYIFYLGNSPSGSACWHFEIRRYLGDKGLEVQKTRYVPFLAEGELVKF